MRTYLSVIVGSCWLVSGATTEGNLNGENLIGKTPHGRSASLFPKHFKDYPRGAEYVDIYSPPIKTLYSQVFWTRLQSVPLPDYMVDRFKGKAMAIIGFETDQVRQTPAGDVSVPITVAYNHHNNLVMEGAESEWVKVPLDDPQLHHQHGGHLPVDEHGDSWLIQDAVANPAFPTSATLGGGNGGEYRKTFHGYAPGIAQVVGSPKAFSVTPMQIDTWNRDKMNITGGPFVSGPVPRNTLAPTEGPDALYSGLFECPLTTRIRKVIDGEYTTAVAGSCADAILTPEECWTAAEKLFPSMQIAIDQGSNTTFPGACSVTSNGSGHAAVFFNYAASGVPCGGVVQRSSGEASALINFSVTIDATENLMTMKLTGPSDVWFGIGYNATAMADQPWTVIVDGAGAVTERLLGAHAPGKLLPATVRVISSTVQNGRRIVVFTRPLDAEHNPFRVTDRSVNIITAIGESGTFGYHKNKGTLQMTLLAMNLATCVCAHKPAAFGRAKGSFVYMGKDSVRFNNRCAPQPRIDLLAQRNPTCDIRTYTGGQLACHHMWSLLDAHQEIPWPDQPIEYSIKIRVWYQDYDPSYHQQVTYLGHLFSIGAGDDGVGFGAEYDVPQCPKGTPAKDCVHEITGTFDVDGVFHTGNKKVNLVAVHFHCHAPTCLDMAVYNNKTGELLCKEFAVYGGTGKIDDKRFDEPGYIAVPPCIWGSEEFGLESPPDVTGMTVTVVKHTNSTYGHHGEMAHGEIFVVEQPRDPHFV